MGRVGNQLRRLGDRVLTGKLTRESEFADDDHRNFNRHGERFDVGETFSGVDYDVALDAVDEIRRVLPPGMTMSQFALRWILMFDAVSCAIPGGKRAGQVAENCAAAELPALTEEGMSAIRKIHGQRIHGLVHHRW
jgi:aryl-alcohol dehydrogenase-like predicted oxidoreductase